MSRAKSAAKSAMQKSLMILPTSTLARLEAMAALALGKGWGASTVEAEVAACLSQLKSSKDPLVALDIGANVGSWTTALLAAQPNARVYAFEPSQVAFRKLEEQFASTDQVQLVNVALGRQAGVAQLWSDVPGSGLGSLTRRRLDHFDIDLAHSEQVNVTTVDAWTELSGVAPSVVKIDVEGHELDVLTGATRTLQTVRVVQFEFGGTNIDTRTYFQDFFYFFKQAGFTINRLGPKGLNPIPQYHEIDESFLPTNYLAIR